MNGSKGAIFDSILFIENRLSDELSINELAVQTFFSKTHYKRLFQAVVGEPVMEYIKKRRLQRAGMMLCETDASVLEIALQFGYSSHEGFSRAFKEHFGIPPLHYRKRYAVSGMNINHEEAENMIATETRAKVARYIEDIAKDFEKLVAKVTETCEPVPQFIDNVGRAASGIKVVFAEWANLISKIEMATEETRKIAENSETAYDLYDKADMIMKVAEDINFQMHFLCFMAGVEHVKMGKLGTSFEPVLEGLSVISKDGYNNGETIMKLVIEINAQILAEIKREAAGCVLHAAELLREAVREGASLTEKLNMLVIKMGTEGRGFSSIAKEMVNCVSDVRDTESLMLKLAGEIDKASIASLPQLAEAENAVFAGLKHMQNTVFRMNINAFNAAVESAHAGDPEDCVEHTQGIANYAGQLMYAYKACREAESDYFKQMTLLLKKDEDVEGNENNIQNQHCDKFIDSVIFQAKVLNTQLSLESERSYCDNLRALSRDFEKALDKFMNEVQLNKQRSKTDELRHYCDNISALMEQGMKDAKAACDNGAGVAYVLKGYENIIGCVR